MNEFAKDIHSALDDITDRLNDLKSELKDSTQFSHIDIEMVRNWLGTDGESYDTEELGLPYAYLVGEVADRTNSPHDLVRELYSTPLDGTEFAKEFIDHYNLRPDEIYENVDLLEYTLRNTLPEDIAARLFKWDREFGLDVLTELMNALPPIDVREAFMRLDEDRRELCTPINAPKPSDDTVELKKHLLAAYKLLQSSAESE